MEINPNDDGIKHFNIYTKAKTELGKWLSNFTHTPFTHPEYGHWESMEGFWYWASTGMQHETLRNVYGFKAKEVGKKYIKRKNPKFKEMIKSALECKLNTNLVFRTEFKRTVLPLKHYYYYGNPNYGRIKIIEPPSGKFFTSILEEIRDDMKKEK